MNNFNSPTFSILTTERLTLRKLSIDDQQVIFDLRSDPDVNKYLGRQPCESKEDAVNFINKINENIEKNISLYWAITLTDSKTFVGTICLFDFSNEKSSCEIGYELFTKFQGQRIMKEALQAVINYAFQSLGFKNIIAYTHPQNLNSIKLLIRFNFEKSPEKDDETPNLIKFTLNNKI